jgi:hypothetical protein
VAKFPEWSDAAKARLWRDAEMFFDPTIFRDVSEVYEWLKEGNEQHWLAFPPEELRKMAGEHPDGIIAEWLISEK